jgi:hypothetical protein
MQDRLAYRVNGEASERFGGLRLSVVASGGIFSPRVVSLGFSSALSRDRFSGLIYARSSRDVGWLHSFRHTLAFPPTRNRCLRRDSP